MEADVHAMFRSVKAGRAVSDPGSQLINRKDETAHYVYRNRRKMWDEREINVASTLGIGYLRYVMPGKNAESTHSDCFSYFACCNSFEGFG